MATDFDGYQRALVKDVGGFSGPKAQMWIGFTGRYKDEELDLLRQWRTERYPADCGDDALPLVASTFNLRQFAAEDATEFRARLVPSVSWDDIWKLAGSWTSIETNLLASGSTAVSVTERYEVDPADEFYTQTIFVVDEPGFTTTLLATNTTLPFVLGSTISATRIREMVAIILEFKSAHCIPTILQVQDGIGGSLDFTIYDVLGSSTFILGAFRLGAPVEY